jgi:6-phosphogluconate dehydrogenase (decarboxylating)
MTDTLDTTETTETVEITEDVEETTEGSSTVATAFLSVAAVVLAAVTTKTLIKRFRHRHDEDVVLEDTPVIEATATES